MEESFARLQERVPEGAVRMLDGAGGVKVICQERIRYNFDLTHENWSEAGEEALGGVGVLVTGEKGSGKTTFLGGLTSGGASILQALRYDSSAFYNIWYGVTKEEIDALLESLEHRPVGYFQTELAHGSMVLPGSEYWLFQDDEEFKSPTAPQPPPVPYTHVLLRVLEIGGDALQILPDPPASKRAIYQSIKAMLATVATVCYFVGVDGNAAPGLVQLKKELDAVKWGGEGTRLVIFTRAATPPEELVAAARTAGFECEVNAYFADHLDPDTGKADAPKVLQTLHRMLRHAKVDAHALKGLVSEQVAGMFLRHHPGARVTAASYAEMLEEVHHELEHGAIYNETFQPVMALPPAYLTTVFPDVMKHMVARGFALPPASVTITRHGADGASSVVFSATTEDHALPQDPALRTLVEQTLGLEVAAAEPAHLPNATHLLREMSDKAQYLDLCIAAAYHGVASVAQADGARLEIAVIPSDATAA